jgi:hypothetical protein
MPGRGSARRSRCGWLTTSSSRSIEIGRWSS